MPNRHHRGDRRATRALPAHDPQPRAKCAPYPRRAHPRGSRSAGAR
jgi:hypothetical protein